MSQRFKPILITFFSLVLSGCSGILTWKQVYSSVSPDGKSTLHVDVRSCFADCTIQAVVDHGWTSHQIVWKSDCIVTFAHAAWSANQVGVFVDGFYCGVAKAAFDRQAGRVIEFSSMEAALKNSIIQSYGVTADELREHKGDVFAWATNPGKGSRHRATDEFRQRHLETASMAKE